MGNEPAFRPLYTTELIEYSDDRKERPWAEYIGNNFYSANAQIVMDVLASALVEMGRMPPLMRVRIQSQLTTEEVESAIIELADRQWSMAKHYIERYPSVRKKATKAKVVVPKAAPVAKAASKRKPITGDLRGLVWAKSDGVCWYCGSHLNPFTDFHVDHFIPVADGGTNDPRNLVPSCQRCNSEKGAKHIEAFRAARGGCIFWFERSAK